MYARTSPLRVASARSGEAASAQRTRSGRGSVLRRSASGAGAQREHGGNGEGTEGVGTGRKPLRDWASRFGAWAGACGVGSG